MKKAKKKQNKNRTPSEDGQVVALCRDCTLVVSKLEAILFPDAPIPKLVHEARCGTYSDLPCDCDPIDLELELDLPQDPSMN